MGTNVINNRGLKKLFFDEIDNLITGNLRINAICLTAKSGKGKSTFISFFKEYCYGNINIETVLIDFAVYSVISEFDLIYGIYEQLHTVFEEKYFSNFLYELEKMKQSANQTIIQGINMVNTSIGSVNINNNHITDISFSSLTSAFIKDLDNLPKKIVIFFDTLEKADINIKEIIIKKFVIQKKSKNYFVVMAGKDEIFDDHKATIYSVKNYSLPDNYQIKDYEEYAKDISLKLEDKEILYKAYKYWKGDPFHICITLAPFRGDNDD